MKTLQWISWFQTTEDYRPLTFPPSEPVLGYWCSGQRCFDDAWVLCALVVADDEKTAQGIILKDWPEAQDWRFCKASDTNLGDRFQFSEWMQERVNNIKYKDNLKRLEEISYSFIK